MAKGGRPGGFQSGKVKTKMVVAGGAKNNKPAFPNQGLPSNPIADKQAKMLFMALLTMSFVLVAGALFFAVAMIIAALKSNPMNYFGVAGAVVAIVATFFVARTLLWMSLFGSLMYAQKSNAWEAQLFLCEQAMKLRKLIPGGATTAALLLIQGYISRGDIEQTIKIGQEQYETFGKDPKQVQNLAPMYSTMGLAFHMQGAWRDSIVWNDRAAEAFSKILTNFKERKGIVAKLAGSQTTEWTKNIETQLAVTHFNNGTNHFNLRNYRAAKDSYRQAVEHANQAPDFPEKNDLLKVSKEQLSRLKHT